MSERCLTVEVINSMENAEKRSISNLLFLKATSSRIYCIIVVLFCFIYRMKMGNFHDMYISHTNEKEIMFNVYIKKTLI